MQIIGEVEVCNVSCALLCNYDSYVFFHRNVPRSTLNPPEALRPGSRVDSRPRPVSPHVDEIQVGSSIIASSGLASSEGMAESPLGLLLAVTLQAVEDKGLGQEIGLVREHLPGDERLDVESDDSDHDAAARRRWEGGQGGGGAGGNRGRGGGEPGGNGRGKDGTHKRSHSDISDPTVRYHKDSDYSLLVQRVSIPRSPGDHSN